MPASKLATQPRYWERTSPEVSWISDAEWDCCLALWPFSFPARIVMALTSPARALPSIDSDLASSGRFTTCEKDLRSEYDAIIVANVIHHVPVLDRPAIFHSLANRLSSNGRLFVFEHNPANPLTRHAVDHCKFDADAVLLTPRETIDYLPAAGLRLLQREYIVFFPRWLKALRRLEPHLTWCPIGAQYAIVAHRADQLPG